MKRIGGWLDSFLKDERGGVLILVAVLLVVLLGVSALAVDAGALYQARREMVNAADSAALAGAQELYLNLSGAVNTDVKNYAETYATNNYGCDEATANVNDLEVEVITEKNVDLFFARFLGIDDVDVSARAVAKIGKTTKGNIIPFGMSEDLFNSLPLDEEEEFVYFDDNPFGSGNWSWVYFTQTENAATTVSYLASGFDAKIGDPIWTNTGANIPVGNRKDDVKTILDDYIADETELWVPVIRYPGDMPETGKKEAIIVGFAVIVITGYDVENPKAQTITGKIMKKIFDSKEIDTQGDYSIFYPSGVALIQ